MAGIPQTPPKVFISYSWTSNEHLQWVADLGTRLRSDGVDVSLDQWDLAEGHDIHKFMEQMVTDSTVKRVIIVSDAVYAAKADDRKGGVGTETQIISEKVYKSADQTKFVPVVRERDKDGNACLPVYLKTRKYIDFSDANNEPQAYENLLRNIFDCPQQAKPPLGKPPSHLFSDNPTTITSAQKAKRFCDSVRNGTGNPSAAFRDFSTEFIANFEELRMTYSSKEKESWCERIRTNIDQATAYRDVFVEAIWAGAADMPSQQFMPLLLELLEKILPFQYRPVNASPWSEWSEDNYKLLCYELFLYTFAAFVKARKYQDARQLIDHRYVAPQTFGGTDFQGDNFLAFNSYAASLEDFCAQQGNRRLYSVMADLIHSRATNSHFRFGDIAQADVILWLAAGGRGWLPRCLIYARGTFELFVRAASPNGFLHLQQLLKLQSLQELLQLFESEAIQRSMQREMFWHSRLDICFNLSNLKASWGAPKP